MQAEKKVAIVTGSTSGIGKAIATRLVANDYVVLLHSKQSVEAGLALVKSLPGCQYLPGDIAEEATSLALVDKALALWQRLDLVVNNAALSERVSHLDLSANSDELFAKMWQTNFMGAWYLSRAAIPYLQQATPGHLINISSVAGVKAVGSSIPYAVSKAALNHLTQLLARSHSKNLRINAIAPGLIRTERTAAWQDTQHYFASHSAVEQSSGLPENVAALLMGIIEAQYLSGQVLCCDGGFCLG